MLIQNKETKLKRVKCFKRGMIEKIFSGKIIERADSYSQKVYCFYACKAPLGGMCAYELSHISDITMLKAS